MNRTNIEWCDYTWNPITGCLRGCEYCYAKRINDRFCDRPFTDIVFHPERLDEPSKVKKPSVIFVGSMSDVSYWGEKRLDEIFNICISNSRHTFMFLSKGKWNIRSYPDNVMIGITITSICDDITKKRVEFHSKLHRPFLSIEPLLGEVDYMKDYENIEKIIVGAMTGPGAIVPKKEWLDSLANIPNDKLFLKSNIKKYFGGRK